VLWAFALLYMLLTSFKAEADAVPPFLWIPHPTLQNDRIVLQQQILHYRVDSTIISVTTVAIRILVGVSTSYVIVFGRLKRADNLLFRVHGLLDVPREILESADIDGASRLRSFFSTVVPMCRQGIVSIGLLVLIFVWNEFFFSINLTYVNAAPVPVYMASFMTQEGLFWAEPPPTGSRGVLRSSAKADWGCLIISSERVSIPQAWFAFAAAPYCAKIDPAISQPLAMLIPNIRLRHTDLSYCF